MTLHDGDRAWKGFDWAAMGRLYAKGMIGRPAGKAKSVALSEDGPRRAEEPFAALFTKPA